MSPTISFPTRQSRFFAAVSFLFLAPESYAQAHTKGRAVAPFTANLKPGDYAWHPELSPTGPVVILVSLPDQVLYVYRNGVRIANSTVSNILTAGVR
jgi:hypothetical protein